MLSYIQVNIALVINVQAPIRLILLICLHLCFLQRCCMLGKSSQCASWQSLPVDAAKHSAHCWSSTCKETIARSKFGETLFGALSFKFQIWWPKLSLRCIILVYAEYSSFRLRLFRSLSEKKYDQQTVQLHPKGITLVEKVQKAARQRRVQACRMNCSIPTFHNDCLSDCIFLQRLVDWLLAAWLVGSKIPYVLPEPQASLAHIPLVCRFYYSHLLVLQLAPWFCVYQQVQYNNKNDPRRHHQPVTSLSITNIILLLKPPGFVASRPEPPATGCGAGTRITGLGRDARWDTKAQWRNPKDYALVWLSINHPSTIHHKASINHPSRTRSDRFGRDLEVPPFLKPPGSVQANSFFHMSKHTHAYIAFQYAAVHIS